MKMATAQTTPRLDVRADFPIFRREFGGRPLVYLDSAATSQKPESVIAAMDDYYRAHNANIHRGVYTLCQEVGAELRWLEVSDDGKLSLEQLDSELGRGNVKLVGFAHVSNVLGTIN